VPGGGGVVVSECVWLKAVRSRLHKPRHVNGVPERDWPEGEDLGEDVCDGHPFADEVRDDLTEQGSLVLNSGQG